MSALFQFIVEDTFFIQGRGLLLTPFFAEAKYRFGRSERIRIETPDLRTRETEAFFEIPMISPTPKVFEYVCVLRGVEKHAVPIGSKVTLLDKHDEDVIRFEKD